MLFIESKEAFDFEVFWLGCINLDAIHFDGCVPFIYDLRTSENWVEVTESGGMEREDGLKPVKKLLILKIVKDCWC